MVIIYQLKSKTTGKIYIGSTKHSLDKRVQGHKTTYLRKKNGNHDNCYSFSIIEEDNFEASILEECQIENRYERERYWILKQKDICLNHNIPTVEGTSKYEKNKVHILKWRENNMEEYKAYRKAYSINDKAYQAQYRMYKRECNRLQNIEI
jgi:hypothetical protein